MEEEVLGRAEGTEKLNHTAAADELPSGRFLLPDGLGFDVGGQTWTAPLNYIVLRHFKCDT